IDVHIAVLGGDDGEALVEGDFELEGVHLEVAAYGDGAGGGVDVAGQALVDEDGVDVGGGDGEVEQGGVRDRAAGVFESRNRDFEVGGGSRGKRARVAGGGGGEAEQR